MQIRLVQETKEAELGIIESGRSICGFEQVASMQQVFRYMYEREVDLGQRNWIVAIPVRVLPRSPDRGLVLRRLFFSNQFPIPKPILRVTFCMELLKVASQIQYQELVDMGMKHLAPVPWIHGQEEIFATLYFAADCANGLKARLDLPLMVDEETHVNYVVLEK